MHIVNFIMNKLVAYSRENNTGEGAWGFEVFAVIV